MLKGILKKKIFKLYVIDSMFNYNILIYILFFINKRLYRWMVLKNLKFILYNIILGIYVFNIIKL